MNVIEVEMHPSIFKWDRNAPSILHRSHLSNFKMTRQINERRCKELVYEEMPPIKYLCKELVYEEMSPIKDKTLEINHAAIKPFWNEHLDLVRVLGPPC